MIKLLLDLFKKEQEIQPDIRVMRRLDPPVRLGRMTPEQQRTFWKKSRLRELMKERQ